MRPVVGWSKIGGVVRPRAWLGVRPGGGRGAREGGEERRQDARPLRRGSRAARDQSRRDPGAADGARRALAHPLRAATGWRQRWRGEVGQRGLRGWPRSSGPAPTRVTPLSAGTAQPVPHSRYPIVHFSASVPGPKAAELLRKFRDAGEEEGIAASLALALRGDTKASPDHARALAGKRGRDSLLLAAAACAAAVK
jgi:hypothetical protein